MRGTFNQGVLSYWRKAGTGAYSHGPLRRFTHAMVDPSQFFCDHPTKLGGHRPSLSLDAMLAAKFDCISALYEINIHANGGKYDLYDYDEIGVALTKSVSDYFRFK